MPEHRFIYRRRVEFADTDVAGIMHFSNFFKFMEVSEHAFYRSLGFSVHPFGNVGDHGGEAGENSENPGVGWPRVHASADFKLPLKFEEEVEVEVLIEEIRSKAVRYFFKFWKFPDSPERRCVAATGRFTAVCVRFDEELRRMKAVAIPNEVREKIEAAPRELIDDDNTAEI